MKRTGFAALLLAGAMMFTGCTSGELKKEAMSVGSEKITIGDISAMTSLYVQFGGQDFETAKETNVEQMEEALKYAAAAKAMGIELEEDAKTQATQMRAQYAQLCGGLSAYKKFLAKSGSSLDTVDRILQDSTYQTLLEEKAQEEIGDAEPTDDELKTYFEENYYRAKHILISVDEESDAEATEDTATADPNATEAPKGTVKTDEEAEKLANELMEKAQNGEDFDALIKEYSTDPGSESNPDGYVFTDGQMVTEFEEAVKSLEPGKFTVCKTDYGYHVIERLPLTKGDSVFETAFTDDKESIKSAYSDKQIQDKIDEYCEQNNVSVNINQEAIDAFEEKDMVLPEVDEEDDTSSSSSSSN